MSFKVWKDVALNSNPCPRDNIFRGCNGRMSLDSHTHMQCLPCFFFHRLVAFFYPRSDNIMDCTAVVSGSLCEQIALQEVDRQSCRTTVWEYLSFIWNHLDPDELCSLRCYSALIWHHLRFEAVCNSDTSMIRQALEPLFLRMLFPPPLIRPHWSVRTGISFLSRQWNRTTSQWWLNRIQTLHMDLVNHVRQNSWTFQTTQTGLVEL